MRKRFLSASAAAALVGVLITVVSPGTATAVDSQHSFRTAYDKLVSVDFPNGTTANSWDGWGEDALLEARSILNGISCASSVPCNRARSGGITYIDQALQWEPVKGWPKVKLAMDYIRPMGLATPPLATSSSMEGFGFGAAYVGDGNPLTGAAQSQYGWATPNGDPGRTESITIPLDNSTVSFRVTRVDLYPRSDFGAPLPQYVVLKYQQNGTWYQLGGPQQLPATPTAPAELALPRGVMTLCIRNGLSNVSAVKLEFSGLRPVTAQGATAYYVNLADVVVSQDSSQPGATSTYYCPSNNSVVQYN